ncbi:MAG: dipeptidase, partial [Ferruginibacter sp.]|nr:dipeptidase [Ferruginibacter sp.]
MIRTIIACLLYFVPLIASAQAYKKLHFKSIVVDTHNDLLSTAIEKNLQMDSDLSGKTHSDLDRFQKGGVDVQLFSVWCDGQQANPYAWANRQMDTLDAVAKRNPGKIKMAGRVEALRQAVKEKKLAAMFGVEGGHMIENNLDNLDNFYKRGVRYMTLTWNNSTDWATSALTETSLQLPPKEGEPGSVRKMGLTDFGKQVIKRMNE